MPFLGGVTINAARIHRNGRARVAAAIAATLLTLTASSAKAQTETDSARSERHKKTEASLAKAAQNPVANMVSLPL